MHNGTAVAQYILRLAKAADTGDFVLALKICRKMKEEGVTPNLAIFNNLLHACCQTGLSLETWAIFDDMDLMGIKPDRQSCHYLINVR
jgi:pentatricopeptide repeat protein